MLQQVVETQTDDAKKSRREIGVAAQYAFEHIRHCCLGTSFNSNTHEAIITHELFTRLNGDDDFVARRTNCSAVSCRNSSHQTTDRQPRIRICDLLSYRIGGNRRADATRRKHLQGAGGRRRKSVFDPPVRTRIVAEVGIDMAGEHSVAQCHTTNLDTEQTVTSAYEHAQRERARGERKKTAERVRIETRIYVRCRRTGATTHSKVARDCRRNAATVPSSSSSSSSSETMQTKILSQIILCFNR
jgi:hypothetical protein